MKNFKADIIRLIREEKQPISKVAKNFGVNNQTIRNWLKAVNTEAYPTENRIAELESQLKEKNERVLICSKR